MRRDAQEHRDALIRAAADCFRESGFMVPLEEIASRAQVGRGTLYRNFKDRLALASAVVEVAMTEAMSTVSRQADAERALRHVLEWAARAAAIYHHVAAGLPLEEQQRRDPKEMERRATEYFRPILERAQDAGVIRKDLRPDVMIMLIRMLSSLLQPSDDDATVRRKCSAAWELLMTGLRPG